METISHQRARSLIQSATDGKLVETEQKLLQAHLGECPECGKYAEHLSRLEADLVNAFHVRWGEIVPKLSIQTIKERSAVVRGQNRSIKFLGRVAVVPLLMLISIFMFFVIEQQHPRSSPNSPASSAISPASPLAPLKTPSPQTAPVKQRPTECHFLSYLVKEGETLSTIAANFGISEETLLQSNHLLSSAVYINLELSIPICENVQSTSTTTPTITSTFAPSIVNASPTPQG